MENLNLKINNTRTLIVIFSMMILESLSFGTMIPVLFFWVSGITPSAIIYGFFLSIYVLMLFFFAPLWGRVGDLKGHRLVILIGLVGVLSSNVILFLNAIFFDSLLLLFLSRLVAGIFSAAIYPIAQVYISKTTCNKDRIKGFGFYGASISIGIAIGPLIGSFLISIKTSFIQSITIFWLPLVFIIVLELINLLIGMRNLPEIYFQNSEKDKTFKHSNHKRWYRANIFEVIRSNPSVSILFFLFAIGTMVFSSFEATLILFIAVQFGMDQTLIAFSNFSIGATFIVIQVGILQILSKKVSDIGLIIGGFFILTLGLIGITISKTGLTFGLWVIPLAIGCSLLQPVLSGLLSKFAVDKTQGLILGFKEGLVSLMRIFGFVIGTLTFDLNIFLPYYFGIFILILAIIPMWVLVPLLKSDLNTDLLAL